MAKVTVQQFLSLLADQVGYVEKPINKTKYSRKFGVRVAQWCGYLHNWVAVKCGWKLGVHVPNTAYTPNGVAWFKQHGVYKTKGEIPVGAWVYFDFPGDNVNRVSHVGTCVFDFGDGDVLTIEGNTTGPKGLRVDQRNGGECAVKIRSKSLIVGWGVPPYVDAPHPIVEQLVVKYAQNKIKYDVEFLAEEGI